MRSVGHDELEEDPQSQEDTINPADTHTCTDTQTPTRCDAVVSFVWFSVLFSLISLRTEQLENTHSSCLCSFHFIET